MKRLDLLFCQLGPDFAPVGAKIATRDSALCKALDRNTLPWRNWAQSVEPLIHKTRAYAQGTRECGSSELLGVEVGQDIHELHYSNATSEKQAMLLDRSPSIAT